jgi:hypothetical protein
MLVNSIKIFACDVVRTDFKRVLPTHIWPYPPGLAVSAVSFINLSSYGLESLLLIEILEAQRLYIVGEIANWVRQM